jgi:hypothetical protein
MAKLLPMDSKETCVGIPGKINSHADMGGGTLEMRSGVNLSVSKTINLDKERNYLHQRLPLDRSQMEELKNLLKDRVRIHIAPRHLM